MSKFEQNFGDSPDKLKIVNKEVLMGQKLEVQPGEHYIVASVMNSEVTLRKGAKLTAEVVMNSTINLEEGAEYECSTEQNSQINRDFRNGESESPVEASEEGPEEDVSLESLKSAYDAEPLSRYHRYAEALEDAGDLDTVISVYRNVIELSDSQGKLLGFPFEKLGEIYEKQGKYKEAMEAFKEVIRRNRERK